MTDAADALPGRRLLELVRVMDTLRVNCPWDANQTHESLTPYLLEETYEAVDALTAGDQAAVREELGDVLLQVVFNARVAAERTDGTGYTIDDVADGIIDKLTRRHPHVFGDVSVSGAGRGQAELGHDQGRRTGGRRPCRDGIGARRRAAEPARAVASCSAAAPGRESRGTRRTGGDRWRWRRRPWSRAVRTGEQGASGRAGPRARATRGGA